MPSVSQLQDMMVKSLVRSAGGSQRRWRIALGPISLRNVQQDWHCNWSVTPSGSARENAEIEKLLDRVRLEHPQLTEG